MSAKSAFVVARATVHECARISPSFVRISVRGPDIDLIGTPGRTFDQRIKVILPGANRRLPVLTGADDWYAEWQCLPDEDRGFMRTYSLRDVQIQGTLTTLVIDFVLHEGEHASGPGSAWARRARPGDEIVIIGPRRDCNAGGVEFQPGDLSQILLAGDETAAPAIARILEDSPRSTRGHAFLEVPSAADILAIDAPDKVKVTWLPRGAREHGSYLTEGVLTHLRFTTSPDAGHVVRAAAEMLNEELVWDTKFYSNTDDAYMARGQRSFGSDTYYWIAGESSMVTALRRHIVSGLGVNRSQVAFMGYWRK